MRLGPIRSTLNKLIMADTKKDKLAQNPLAEYIRSSFEEIRRVTWPTKNQAVRLTFLVLGFCMVAAMVLGGLDVLFGMGHEQLLNLRSSIVSDQPVSVGDISATDASGNPVTILPTEQPSADAPADAATAEQPVTEQPTTEQPPVDQPAAEPTTSNNQ